MTRQQLEDRLRFEGLISDLSAGFVNISSEEVEGEINKWLQRITEFFDADRCSLGVIFGRRDSACGAHLNIIWKESNRRPFPFRRINCRGTCHN